MARFTIISEGLDESVVQSALETIPDFKLKKIKEVRGDQDITKVTKFIAEFVGGPTRIADALLEILKKVYRGTQAGGSIKIKVNDMEIEVTNANRSQLIELLNIAINIAKEINPKKSESTVE